MIHLWNYAENIKRTTSTGEIGIFVTPAKNQIISNMIMIIDSIAGYDTGGTSETGVDLTLLNCTIRKLYEGLTDRYQFLPDEDEISNFGNMSLDKLVLHAGDILTIKRSRFAVDGTMRIAIRAKVNIHELPTITYYNAQTIRHALYYDKLIGVIE